MSLRVFLQNLNRWNYKEIAKSFGDQGRFRHIMRFREFGQKARFLQLQGVEVGGTNIIDAGLLWNAYREEVADHVDMLGEKVAAIHHVPFVQEIL